MNLFKKKIIILSGVFLPYMANEEAGEVAEL